jgi:hypothetical protein
MDEDQERAEQAEMARREAQMLEMAAAAEADVAGNAEGEGEGEQEEEEERDLDADVPEAEEEADDSDEEGSGVDVTFNEESLLEGSIDGDGRDELEMEDAELLGRLQDERDLGLERDLDDSVPEAGSYQHTDTEAEDDSSIEFDSDDEPVLRQSVSAQSTRNPVRSSGGNGRTSRILTDDQSSILGSSSFVGSSPAVGRGLGRGNAFRSRMISRRGGSGA